MNRLSFSWTTFEELNFIRDLAARNREALVNYTGLLNSGMRRFDPNIDVAAVRSAANRALNGGSLAAIFPANGGDAVSDPDLSPLSDEYIARLSRVECNPTLTVRMALDIMELRRDRKRLVFLMEHRCDLWNHQMGNRERIDEAML